MMFNQRKNFENNIFWNAYHNLREKRLIKSSVDLSVSVGDCYFQSFFYLLGYVPRKVFVKWIFEYEKVEDFCSKITKRQSIFRESNDSRKTISNNEK